MVSNNQLQYVSYSFAHKIPEDQLIAVDFHYPRGLVLAHVYEEGVPQVLRANTSTASAFKWMSLPKADQEEFLPNPRYVTCNHWDIDGFIAVWSLLNPNIASQHQGELEATAMLGDFREFDPYTPNGIKALKICALLNRIESATFCLPFGDLMGATIEYEVAEQKFNYFLPRFAQWLERIDDYSILWQNEFNEVLSHFNAIEKGEVQIEELNDLGLSIITSPGPLHYYAVFSKAKNGAVLTLLPNQHYVELEYKYETRVKRLDRETKERIDLKKLAANLSLLETSPGIKWVFDNINEGGPILRPEQTDHPISRTARYQSMKYRLEGNSTSTAIPLEKLRSLIIQELKNKSLKSTLLKN